MLKIGQFLPLFMKVHLRGVNMFTKLVKKGSVGCFATCILKVTLTIISYIPTQHIIVKVFRSKRNLGYIPPYTTRTTYQQMLR